MIKLKLGSHCNGRGRVSMINTAMVQVLWKEATSGDGIWFRFGPRSGTRDRH